MATSGTYGTYVYRVAQLIEDAGLSAGVPAQMLTPEVLTRSMRLLNLLFSEMPNLRIFTWQQQQILIPLYQGIGYAVPPPGTFNLLDRNLRTPVRLTGTFVSSAGGNVALAEDDDFTTILQQTAPAGNVSLTMTAQTQVFEIGILWGVTDNLASFVVERSNDTGVTWLQVGDPHVIPAVDNTWTWIALQGAVPSYQWRVRSTSSSGVNFAVRELYFGGQYNDIPIAKFSRTQFSQLSNRNQQGQPLQGWLDRQVDGPVLQLWYAPSKAYRYCHVAAFQQRMIADVTGLRQTLDVPARWYQAIKTLLAVRMCETFEEAKKERLADLRSQYMQAQLPAVSEDRDDSPIMNFPRISAYT